MKFLIMIDFDGTLVDIAARPDLIRVRPEVSELLGSLQKDGHAVYIVTGRYSDDVKTRLAPASIPVIGLHGLDWNGKASEERHPLFDRIGKQVSTLAADFPGFYYENKHVIIGFHFRQIDDQLKERAKEKVRSIIAEHLAELEADDSLCVIEGREVIELKPSTMNKAIAAQMLVSQYPDFFPIYIGDDLPDEEAMAALGNAALTIRVSATPLETQAQFQLESPAQVLEFLRSLL